MPKKKKSLVGWTGNEWGKRFKPSGGDKQSPAFIMSPSIFVPAIVMQKEWGDFYKKVRITIEEIY